MRKYIAIIIASLALFTGQAHAQRCLPKMQGIEVRADMADGFNLGGKDGGYSFGAALSTYTKKGNKWVFGGEYLLKNNPYKDTKIPVAQFTAEGGYYFKILSDARKIVFVYAGASALAGYEAVNWGKKVLHDGSTLHDRDAFIYGGALTLDVECYVETVSPCLPTCGSVAFGVATHGSSTRSSGSVSSSSSTDTGMERTEIDAVRRMPLADFLARLGHEPVRRSGNELWYLAPYRGERTSSFRVNVAKQLWYDFGLGKGGDIFTLAGEFLQSDDFMKQAKFIAEAANMTVAGWEKPVYLSKPTESVFEDVEVAPLLRSLLTEYLEERGIPYAIASRHCCRLNYGVRGKRYFAVGFPNMAGGYEVRSRYFKGCIPPKSVSLVKANDIPADECLVFEGFMDFLSAVTLGVTGNADCLVLNSVANVEKAAGLLDGYGRIGCFLDRDEAGRRTLAALTMRYGERVTDRSSLYDGCKDLNEYLQLTTKKQKNNHLKIEEQ